MFTKHHIEKFSQLETPFYYYDLSLLDETLDRLRKASGQYGYRVHYAMKANVNKPILKRICAQGFGADCVSGNEILRALEIGFPTEDIVFAGVGKSDKEMQIGLDNDIFCFNCESVQELAVLNQLAGAAGKTARVALRINPNLDAKTHHHITTGLEENKFGIPLEKLDEAIAAVHRCEHLNFIGLHFHIGSQVTDMPVFEKLCIRANEIQESLVKNGLHPEHINLGGGLSVNYQDPNGHKIADFDTYFGIVNRYLTPLPGQTVHFELGRSLVAQCGSLISRVLFVKEGLKTRFAVLDAGMTELIRPALYSATHHIENLSGNGKMLPYDVVGPICESSDCFGKNVSLATVERGNIIAIRTAGAYGEIMASRYNLRDYAPAVYSEEA